MRLTKAQRAEVFAMFEGRCAYCGVALGERWHADHKEPIIRSTWLKRPGTPDMMRPENHRLDNIFPACAPCNIDKGSFCVEGFREWIATHLNSLRSQANFKNAMRHGLVAETGAPVIFYFERCPPQEVKD